MGEIHHGGIFHSIRFSKGNFCRSTFLLGGKGICEKKFLTEGGFSEFY